MSLRQSFGFPLSVDLGTDVGRIRDNNEDSFGSAWLEDGSLFVIVADGMGGHEAGEVASSLAVRVVEDMVRIDAHADPRERLYNALLEANRAILEEGASSGTRGMGTTAITAILKGNQVYIGQVGDSRCYQIRKGHKVWRTTDHTRVQMLVNEGRLTEDQARHHPEAGMLTRALGHARMADGQALVPEVSEHPVLLEQGDTLILCSDGLHDLVEDDEIAQAIAGKDPETAIQTLIDMACERGGHDNITIALVNTQGRVAAYDASYQPPQSPARPLTDDASTDEQYATFDMSEEVFGPPGMPKPAGSHLHAPTVAPGDDFPSAAPAGPPPGQARPAPAPAAEAPPSNMPLILGIVAVSVVALLGVLGCGGGLAAWFFLSA